MDGLNNKAKIKPSATEKGKSIVKSLNANDLEENCESRYIPANKDIIEKRKMYVFLTVMPYS